MKTYLVIPRMIIKSANAQPAWWVAGQPGPMAFCGFGLALARHLDEEAGFQSIGLVWHDFRFRAERFDAFGIRPHQHRAAALIDQNDYAKETKNLSGQPTIRGDGCVSVVLAFEGYADISGHSVVKFLRNARVAGGAVESHLFDPQTAILTDSLSEVENAMKSGFCVVDRADALIPLHGEDPLAAFLRATRIEKAAKGIAEDEVDKNNAPFTRWMPYQAAFRALTPFSQRHAVREGLAHAFVEPLIGLSELVARKKSPIVFWQLANPEANVFCVQPVPSTHVMVGVPTGA